jgi:acetylornithine deacetylase/succinyl-diaminopimelate desuccinylase-like protein
MWQDSPLCGEPFDMTDPFAPPPPRLDPITGVRPDFLRKFVAFLLPVVVFTVALLEGAGFRQPDWVFLDISEARKSPEFQRLRDYVRIDTTSPPGRERLGTDFLGAIFEAEGIPFETICPEGDRCNLVARIEGRREGGGLLLLHHIDVYPANPTGWVAPPFAADLVDGDVVGRGTIDDKSLGLAYLRAFLDLRRSGKVPERPIVFLADADEENIQQRLGIRWILANRPDLLRGIGYALNEGGVNETPGDQVQYWGIEVAQGSLAELVLEAPTRERLESLKAAMAARPRRWTVAPVVRDFFSRIALVRKAPWRERLDDLDAALLDPRFVEQLPESLVPLLRVAVFPKEVEPWESGFRTKITVSIPPEVDPGPVREEILGEIAAVGGVRIATEIWQPRSLSVPLDSPLFEVLVAETRRDFPWTPVGPYANPLTSTTSKYLRQEGIHAYGFSPFRVTIRQAFGIHRENERINLDAYLRGLDLTSRIIARFASVPAMPEELDRASRRMAK